MFKVERIRRIKEIIQDCKEIDVSTLSGLLGVSDATIRTDLESLEKEGFLTRFHGGATLNATEETVTSSHAYDITPVEYDKNKEEIGNIAARLIREREWVFLGPGSTTYYIALALRQRSNINVMTNSFLVANALQDAPTIKVRFIGGQIENQGFYTVPDSIADEFSNIYLNKAFFSVDAVDLESGYTLSDLPVFEVIQTVTAKAKETIFAVDYMKFGQRAFMKIADLDDIKTVITNDHIDFAYKKYFSEHGICVYTTYDLKPISL